LRHGILPGRLVFRVRLQRHAREAQVCFCG
jgi:hypothetical protein